jgi:hypothetical protein
MTIPIRTDKQTNKSNPQAALKKKEYFVFETTLRRSRANFSGVNMILI